MQWKDKSLNNVCSRQLAVCSYFFDLSELENHIESTSQLKLLFSVEGPLHSVPLSWLSYHGRPIFEEADATNVAISLTLHRHQRLRETSKMNRSSVFCGLWEQPGQRKSFGFPILWRGVQRWSEKNGSGRHKKVCYGCCDDPLLTPENLISATHSKKCDILILAGHGADGKFGIEFSGGEHHSPASLWRGEGDFSNCSLIILLSCSVGRLRHSSITDVQGLYTRILANGGGNVVAAKWDVDDCYGASFLLEFLDEYALINRRNETLGVAFNNARKKAWKRYLSQLSSKEVEEAKCHHAIAAFDYFGYT
jgi:CHAT domain-containing protein